MPTDAVVVFPTVSRSSPSSLASAVRDLPAGRSVTLVGQERGENWVIGDQDWVPTSHEWERTWYRLDDGSYVYRAFVFLPDRASLPGPGGGERYVIVDLASQTAWAMVGQTAVREMPVTTGKPGFETPTGTWEVLAAGRILDERMTSQRAGFDDPGDRYDVQHVLYTQYFAEGGFALHMNYWQPTGVFGEIETSHGCVGLLLEDAQYLWMFGRPGMRVIVRNGGGPGAPPTSSTPQPSASPTPPPAPATEVKVYAVQDGKPGAPAVVAARTLPGTGCALTYVSASGVRRELPGMEPHTSDAAGWLEWKWTIEPDAPPGRGVVTVSCPGGSASADFYVR
ncbi:MAG: L,D-transpeptidase [Dehalococcoidia bacterium]